MSRPARAAIGDLFPPPPTPLIYTRPYLGWHRCDCGVVFWIWPRSGLAPAVDIGNSGPPDLRPYRPWQCWRHIARMSPSRVFAQEVTDA